MTTTTPTAPAGTSNRLGNGELRAMVAKVLADNGGTPMTPRAIAHTLNRSSGAVGNACKVLTAKGEAEVAGTSPLSYKATPATASAAASTITPAPPRTPVPRHRRPLPYRLAPPRRRRHAPDRRVRSPAR